MTRDEIKIILMTVKSVYSYLDVNKILIDIWHAVFSDISFNDAQKALMVYLRQDNEYAPKPGQIYKLVDDLNTVPELTGSEAWALAIEEAKKSTSSEKLKEIFKEKPLVLRAINAVGWERIRYADYSELDFVRNAFIKFYSELENKKEHVKTLALAPKVQNLITMVAK